MQQSSHSSFSMHPSPIASYVNTYTLVSVLYSHRGRRTHTQMNHFHDPHISFYSFPSFLPSRVENVFFSLLFGYFPVFCRNKKEQRSPPPLSYLACCPNTCCSAGINEKWPALLLLRHCGEGNSCISIPVLPNTHKYTNHFTL